MSKNVISSEILKCQNWGKITPFLGVRGQRGHQRGSTPISREHPRRIWNNFASIHFFVRALFRPLMPRTDWRTDWRTDRITFIFLGGLFQCKDPTADAAGNSIKRICERALTRRVIVIHSTPIILQLYGIIILFWYQIFVILNSFKLKNGLFEKNHIRFCRPHPPEASSSRARGHVFHSFWGAWASER